MIRAASWFNLGGEFTGRLLPDPGGAKQSAAAISCRDGDHADNTVVGPVPVAPPTYVTRTSLWQDGAADLYKDARATRVGDLITVKISIKDQASFNNTMSANRDFNRRNEHYGNDQSELVGDVEASQHAKHRPTRPQSFSQHRIHKARAASLALNSSICGLARS